MFTRLRVAAGIVLVAIAFQFGTGCIPRLPGELTDTQLETLRSCEAGGSYTAVSKSGTYRGAYQFDQSTWNSVARRHYPPAVGMDPAKAPAWLQDHLARKLHRERGTRPWPLCGRRI